MYLFSIAGKRARSLHYVSLICETPDELNAQFRCPYAASDLVGACPF